MLALLSHLDQTLHQLLAMHAMLAYGVLFLIVLLQIGVLPLFFLPGNPFLFICGAFGATQELNIVILLPLLIIAAILGSLLNYAFGWKFGQSQWMKARQWPSEAALIKTHLFYEKYGAIGFLFSYFLPVVRTVAPFLAGVAKMRFLRFLQSVSLGTTIWVLVCGLLGYFFGNIPAVQAHIATIVLLGLGLVIIIFVVQKVWHQLRQSH